uniref:UNC80 domain-containing protein n=1 Tax=Globodera pallida TaxID=36090 RepID=A0A183CA60_GLOPA
MTFERVIVQNILHGISPSLSDAIGSISRWNLVRAAFPHIVQCCAALLAERTAEDASLPMSGSLVKSLYILHWLLIDAAVECNENNLNSDSACGGGSGMPSVRQLTYSVASVQLFVYLLGPLFGVVREEEISGHFRLESGFRLWQCLWQQRLPELLCLCAPVKQRRNQLPQLNNATPWAKRAQSTAADQGIYVGDNKPSASLSSVSGAGLSARRPSQLPPTTSSPQPPTTTALSTPIIPPPKPPRTDAKVLKELEEAKQRSASSCTPPTIVRSTDQQFLETDNGIGTTNPSHRICPLRRVMIAVLEYAQLR